MKLTESVGIVKEIAEKCCIRVKHILHHKYDEKGTFSNYDYNIKVEGKEVVVALSADLLNGAIVLSDTFFTQLGKIEHLVGYSTSSQVKKLGPFKLEVRLQLG